MKRKEIIIGLILSLIVFSFLGISFQTNLTHLILFPFQQIASLLRLYSSMHPIGNIFAWAIYVLIGLSPLIYLKFIKKDSHKHDLILYILSICLLLFLYFWINPGYLIYRQHQENLALFIQILFASILYTLIILYLILEFNERMKLSSNLSTLRILRIGLISLQFLFVFMIFGPYLSDITNRIYTAYNPYYHQGNVSTFIFLFLRFISQILPLALSYFLIEQLIKFVELHYQNAYSDDATKSLANLNQQSFKFLLISLGYSLAFQIIILFFYTSSDLEDYSFNLPIPLILIMVGLLFLHHFYISNKQVYDENKGFI